LMQAVQFAVIKIMQAVGLTVIVNQTLNKVVLL